MMPIFNFFLEKLPPVSQEVGEVDRLFLDPIEQETQAILLVQLVYHFTLLYL